MRNLCFGSGPCAKHVGWTFPNYKLAGRSHRSKDGLKLIQDTIKFQREILGIPENYFVGIAPGSCTGAMELLMWNLLGEKDVDVLKYCVFSNHWAHDIVHELKIENVNLIEEKFPKIADVNKLNFSHDVVFCYSSTTSGVSFKDTNWIPKNREGLTICDASSAAFVINFDWEKLDATAFSWQKGLGAEGGFGVVVLSPRAMERLKNFRPNRAIPRIFRIVNDGKINTAFFEGSTINTPSLLCFQELYETLIWIKNSGGMNFLTKKVEENYKTVSKWIETQTLFRFLVEEKFRAHHIICLDIVDGKYQKLSNEKKWEILKKIVEKGAEKNYGYDFLGHILSEPNLRIWCGPTVEVSSLEFFLPKLPELYKEVISENDNC